MKMVTVTVTVTKPFGRHEEGDEMEMEISTARAIAKRGKVVFDDVEDENDSDTSEGMKATDAIKRINAMDSVEEINQFVSDDKRKGVNEAAESRIEELTKEVK